ncbi:MAG: replication protein RepA [Geminicoccaceae bacterium]
MAKSSFLPSYHEQLSMFSRNELLAQASDAKERRRISWAHEIMCNEGDDISFLHAGLCMAALPHRRPKDELEPWIRTNGRFKLAVWPGKMLKKDGGYEPIGVPYGTKARLILLYLMTSAIRMQSRVVPMERSMSAWLRKIGLPVTGGPRGTIKPVREQALRISRCELSLRFDEDGRASLRDRRVVDGLHLWAADESSEWPESVELTQEFYDHLREHAVPLEELAIAKLKGSSLALDLYVWLCYRLPRLERPLTLSWHQLMPQFGSQIKSVNSFAQNVREALLDVLSVYPAARVNVKTGGIELLPARPAVAPRSLRKLNFRVIEGKVER